MNVPREPEAALRVAIESSDPSTARAALRGLDEPALVKVACGASLRVVAQAALAALSDEACVAEVAHRATDSIVAKDAAKRLTRQELLVALALSEAQPMVRRMAVKRLTEGSLLVQIASSNGDVEVAVAALERLEARPPRPRRRRCWKRSGRATSPPSAA